jgi:hypothetical protein
MKFEIEKDIIKGSQVFGAAWLMGIFFIGITSFTLYALFGGANSLDKVPDWQILAGKLISGFGLIGGFYLISMHPKCSFLLDGAAKIIEIKRRGLFKNELQRFHFLDIEGFINDERKDDEDYSYYELVMHTTSGEAIDLTCSFFKDKADYDKKAALMNEFIR